MAGIAVAFTLKAPSLPAVSLNDQEIDVSEPSLTTTSYSIGSDGTVTNQDGATLEAWLQGVGGSAGDYEVRATVTSGSLSSGTTGSWLSCSSTNGWSITNAAKAGTTKTVVLLVEIRLAATGVVQDSATITMKAENLGR